MQCLFPVFAACWLVSDTPDVFLGRRHSLHRHAGVHGGPEARQNTLKVHYTEGAALFSGDAFVSCSAPDLVAKQCASSAEPQEHNGKDGVDEV